LESMACGTPVLATNFDSAGEIIGAPEAGRVLAEATPTGLAGAVERLLAAPPKREATRDYAEDFDWQVTTTGQIELFRDICNLDIRNPGQTVSPASSASAEQPI
jgi:teichuronic acid biosynthesis glycosyltransferase TuaC